MRREREKLKDLLTKFTDEEVTERLVKLYPEQKRSIEGYLKALSELKHTRPIKTSMRIELTTVEEDGEQWVNVGLFDGNKRYSASFTRWGEFVNMEIAPNGFSELDTVCHCIWEMTYYGFSNKKVQEEGKSLWKIAKDANKELQRRNTLS